MVKVITTKSVTYATPVIDPKTKKPIPTKIKHKGREIESYLVDHHRHRANELIDVDKDFAAELVEAGHARMPVVALDDVEVNPTKQEDALA